MLQGVGACLHSEIHITLVKRDQWVWPMWVWCHWCVYCWGHGRLPQQLLSSCSSLSLKARSLRPCTTGLYVWDTERTHQSQTYSCWWCPSRPAGCSTTCRQGECREPWSPDTADKHCFHRRNDWQDRTRNGRLVSAACRDCMVDSLHFDLQVGGAQHRPRHCGTAEALSTCTSCMSSHIHTHVDGLKTLFKTLTLMIWLNN